MKDKFSDTRSLREVQYADSTNLQKRISLHERFSTNPQGLHSWIFSHLKFPPRAAVLELGCGPGTLWIENLSETSSDWTVTLSDFSPGMVDDARVRLGKRKNFSYACIDAQAIPFPSGCWDIVIANHMLYHVSEIGKALREIGRVLRPNGRLFAATNGQGHLKEISEFVEMASGRSHHRDVNVFGDSIKNFSLESGEGELRRYFRDVTLLRYEDSLRVTDAQSILSFVQSSSMLQLSEEGLDCMSDLLESKISEEGAICITKDPGMFIAANPYGI